MKQSLHSMNIYVYDKMATQGLSCHKVSGGYQNTEWVSGYKMGIRIQNGYQNAEWVSECRMGIRMQNGYQNTAWFLILGISYAYSIVNQISSKVAI